MSPTMAGFGVNTQGLDDVPIREDRSPARAVEAAERLDADSDEQLLIAVGNQQSRAAFDKLFRRFANRIFAMGMSSPTTWCRRPC